MVNPDLIKRLLDVAEGDGKEQLQLAVNWWQKARDRAVQRPSAAATGDLERAKAKVEAVCAELAAQYYPAEVEPPPASERFKNLAEAWRWLEAQGVAIKERKFRNDAKAGTYIVYPDKTVSRASVAEYLVRVKGAPVVDLELVDYSQEIRKEQLRKLRIENERLERANRAEDEEWVRRRDHISAMAGLLLLLRDNLHYRGQRAAAELAQVCGGSFELSPLVAEKLMELVVNPAYNDLAGQRISEALFVAMADDGVDDNEQGAQEVGDGATV